MHTIRFDNTAVEHKGLAEAFLLSLQLDPEKWLEEQTFELKPDTRIAVFGLSVLVPVELIKKNYWVCQIKDFISSCSNGSKIFFVENYLVGASISPYKKTEISIFSVISTITLVFSAALNFGSWSILLILIGDIFLSLYFLKQSFGIFRSINNGCINIRHTFNLLIAWWFYYKLGNQWLIPLSITVFGNIYDFIITWSNRVNPFRKILSKLPNDIKVLNLFSNSFYFSFSDIKRFKNLRGIEINGSKILKFNLIKYFSEIEVLNLVDCKFRRLSLKPLQNLNKLFSLCISKNLLFGDKPYCFTDSEVICTLPKLNIITSHDGSLFSALSSSGFPEKLKRIDLKSARGVEKCFNSVADKLTNLVELDISETNWHDASILAPLINLKKLVLDCCLMKSLSPLANMKKLEHLDLGVSENIPRYSQPLQIATEEWEILKFFPHLKFLNVQGIDRELSNLYSLAGAQKLISLKFTSRRIQSIEPLRGIASLRELSEFNPSEVAELLAHTAVLRRDRNHIDENANNWLWEAINFQDGSFAMQDRFATTLGEAFSLLGKHAIELSYEDYLQSKPDFSSAPWKAWLEGTHRQSGSQLMRRRIERQDISLSTPGCIGGICAVMPDQSSPVEDQAWGRHWLVAMESAWQSRAKELLPVSAEVCLAYARLGLKQALDCWLERFTDPSDPAALDPVQAALGQWQLDHAQIESAIKHAAAVQQPATRDPLLAAIVEASYLQAASRAGEVLLMIESEALRGELAVRLVQEAAFAASAVNMERLIVACGHSVESLARLVAHAAPEADAAHLEALSEKLKQSPQAAKDLQRTLSLKLLTELSI